MLATRLPAPAPLARGCSPRLQRRAPGLHAARQGLALPAPGRRAGSLWVFATAAADVEASAAKQPGAIPSRGTSGLLHIASARGHRRAVGLLLRQHKADPSAIDPASGWGPLHFASFYGHKDVVDLLLKHKADPNAITAEGALTPLHLAASQGHKDVVAALLKRKECDANALDARGCSPLYSAAECGQAEVVEALLKARPLDPNAPSHTIQGWAPLHAAAAAGHLGVVQVLRAWRGAERVDPTRRSRAGNTARRLVVDKRNAAVAAELAAFEAEWAAERRCAERGRRGGQKPAAAAAGAAPRP